MYSLKWSVFALAVIACPWGTGHAHLCDNVFRQADKLIVKPEAYNLVVKDKITFKVFLQNNMDRGMSEISLIGDSSAFDISTNPRKMSIPNGQRAFFEVTLAPKPETTTGNYPVNFRLVGGGRLFKSFSVNAGGEGTTGGTAPLVAKAVSGVSSTGSSSGATATVTVTKPEMKAPGGVRKTELSDGPARSTPATQPETNRGPARASVRPTADAARRTREDDQTNRPSARGSEAAGGEAGKGTTRVVVKPDLPAKPKHIVNVHTVSEIPTIDGVIKDPAWKSAAVLANFSAAGGGHAVYDTTGLLMHDATNLYIGVYGADENTEALTAADGIELQWSRSPSGRAACSLFLSPAGKVALKQILPGEQTTFWPASGIRYVVGKEQRSWTLEIVIPFSALNAPASRVPSQWYLRVIRTKASGHAENSYWAPDASGYNSEKGFGVFELVP